jgi:hypothetical protein
MATSNNELIPTVTVAGAQSIITSRLAYNAHLREQGIDPGERNRPLIFLSEPGMGKTYGINYALRDYGLSENEIMFTRDGNFSLVDWIGVPTVTVHEKTGLKMTQFAPMHLAHQAHVGMTDVKAWLHDEVSECPESVQNVLCGVVYDHMVNDVPIDPYILHIMTGNFVENKAGSKELISKLKNRAMLFRIQRDLDGYVAHALSQSDFDRDVVAFLHWKGSDALYGKEGFDPKQPINNSPRQWSAVARLPKPNVTDRSDMSRYNLEASSLVRKGDVAELMAFLKLVNDPGFVPIEKIINDPEKAPVSDKIEVNYALGSRLLSEIKSAKHFEHAMKYVSRMLPEPQTWFVNAAVKHHPEVQGTMAYVKWAKANKAYFNASA